MGDFLHRLTDAVLRSEFLPVFLRMKIMRMVGFRICPDVTIWPGASFRSKNFQIGHNVFINVGFFFDGCAELVIEDNVRIGQYVRVITGTHEIGSVDQRGSVDVVARSVRIERGSWIGAGAILLPGVTIGAGCVIGAGSIVTHATDPSGIYLGNPARRVRDLADESDSRRDGPAGDPAIVQQLRRRNEKGADQWSR